MTTSTNVEFLSDGLRLKGIMEGPLDSPVQVPTIVLIHGFGASKSDYMIRMTAEKLNALGYLTLRFDMRGCGESEGQPGRVLAEEQVRDTQAALSFLQSQVHILPVQLPRIAVLGHSFGAAVAVYTAAVDTRICACISSAGWGDGMTKLRRQHASADAWARFMNMVEHGRAERSAGRTAMVSRFDIVPIPPHLRSGLPEGAHMEFPFDVVESMMAFRPNDVVDQIAPRPLLLLHPSVDAVTPSEQSIELFKRAKMPVDLHLFAGIDHFIFSDDNAIVFDLLKGWLAKHLPLHNGDRGAGR